MRLGKLNLIGQERIRPHRIGFACAVVLAASLVGACPVAADEFLRAIRAGDLAKVKMLVKEQPGLVNRKTDGNSPLYWAVVDHHIQVAKWLLKNGADVNQRSRQYQRTPIFEARTAEMAKLLVDSGANLKVTSRHSATPLSAAVSGNYTGVVKVLLDAGETLDFDAAVKLGKTKLVAKMLAEKPWLAKPPRTPLYYAAQAGNLELVELLLQHGADPDLDFGFSNISGPYTPVTNAVTSGHYEVAERLLRHGASPNVSGGRNHDNLFLFAIAYLDAKFTKLMLDHGADQDRSPLHVASALGGAVGVGSIQRVGQPESLEGKRTQVLKKVRYLLQAGADVNARFADGSTPILFAAIAGHQDVCELLLKQGAELDIGSACLLGKREVVERLVKESPELLNKKDLPLGQPTLHWAVRAGDIEMVKLLLRHGAEVNARAPELSYQDAGGFSDRFNQDSPGPTALHIAAGAGREQVVRLLLDHGAEINLKAGEDFYTRSAVDIACYRGHSGTAKLLLERGAKVDFTGFVEYLMSDMTDTDLFSRLLDAAELDVKGNDGTRLLAGVVANENERAAELLIARGAQPDIFTACILGRVDDVRRLIEATPALAKTVQTSYPRGTPIALAVQNGHVAIVRLLIAEGAHRATLDKNRTTLVHQAAEYGRLDVLQLLLESGFSLDAKDDTGSTLLHAAAAGSQPDLARYLISNGADVNATNFDRETPLQVLGGWHIRQAYEDEDVDRVVQRTVATAKTLLEAGAEVNVKDEYDRTPLHHAASLGLEGVAELLLARDAVVNARDFRNETPLGQVGRSFWRRSFDRRREPVAELLREHGGVE